MQIVHLVFSWSSILSWLIFVVNLGLIAFLTLQAYRDGKTPVNLYGPSTDILGAADTLDRFEVPFFGGLASSFVDNE